jgi:hypothetical protein
VLEGRWGAQFDLDAALSVRRTRFAPCALGKLYLAGMVAPCIVAAMEPDAFDLRLERIGIEAPPHFREAMIIVHDTLDVAWISAKTIFGDKATPELAFEIYKSILGTAAELRSQQEPADD